MRVVPDWREMGKVLKLIITASFIAFMACLILVSCADEWYFGKSREELAREMFIVDSLIMDIKYQIDSTGVDFQSIYLNAQRINSGHE